MPGPDRRLQHGFNLLRFAILALDLAQFRARAGEVQLGPLPSRPRLQKAFKGRQQFQLFRVEAPKVLVVEHQRHAGFLMDAQRIRGAVADVVILKHQPSPHRLAQPLPRRAPAIAATHTVAIRAAYVDHHARLGPALHPVQDIGLRLQIEHASARQVFIFTIQHNEL